MEFCHHRAPKAVVSSYKTFSFVRNNKTCQEHNLKMCSLKQIQKVPIENEAVKSG